MCKLNDWGVELAHSVPGSVSAFRTTNINFRIVYIFYAAIVQETTTILILRDVSKNVQLLKASIFGETSKYMGGA